MHLSREPESCASDFNSVLLLRIQMPDSLCMCLILVAGDQKEEPFVSRMQKTIAAYLNDLKSMGAKGLRIDAVKHINNWDLGKILQVRKCRTPCLIGSYDYHYRTTTCQF